MIKTDLSFCGMDLYVDPALPDNRLEFRRRGDDGIFHLIAAFDIDLNTVLLVNDRTGQENEPENQKRPEDEQR